MRRTNREMRRGRRAVRTIAFAQVVLLVSSCGGGTDPAREGDPFTAEEVSRRFEEVTGETVSAGDVLDLRRFGVGRTIAVSSSELENKYGEFRFVVEISPARPGGVSVVERPRGVTPDDDGVYWEEQFPEDQRAHSSWTAAKYRGNVKLLWFTQTKRKDERWRVLEEVLDTLRARSGS